MEMRLYAIAMTIHVLGIVAVFAGFAIQQRAGQRVRRAARYDEARPWAEMLTVSRSMVPSGALMLLVSGAYMSATRWPGPPTWVTVAIAATLFAGTLSLVVTGPRFGAIGRLLAAGEGALPPVATEAIGRPSTWAVHSSANGAVLGTIWLMTAKPATLEAVLVVLGLAILGAIAGVRVAAAVSGPSGLQRPVPVSRISSTGA